MICIALVVFAGGGHAAHGVDTFPELTPPVLVVGTLAPGPRPEGRREDDHLAHREVRERDARRRPRREHVAQQPLGRLRVAQVGHGPQLGADAGAAAGRVRDVGGAEVARRAAAVRAAVRSRRTRRWCRSRCRAAGSPGRSSTTTRSTTSSRVLEGIPGVASASINGGRQRQINVVVDPVAGAGARRHLDATSPRAVAQSNALLALGRVHLAEVRRQRLHERRRPSAWRTSATPSSSCTAAARC